MPKVTPEYQAARRRHILDAARVCFARRGFAETSVRDICLEAGLSAGAVYVYFDSKDDIVDALAEDVLGRLSDWALGLREAEDPRAALEALVRMLAGTAVAVPPSEIGLRIQGWAAAVTHPRIEALMSDGYAAARAAISTALERGGATGDRDAISRAALAMLQGFLLQVRFDPPADPSLYAETCARLLASVWPGPGA